MQHHIRCDLGLHHWGPVEGDEWGAHRRCTVCSQSRRLTPVDLPSESQQRLSVYR